MIGSAEPVSLDDLLSLGRVEEFFEDNECKLHYHISDIFGTIVYGKDKRRFKISSSERSREFAKADAQDALRKDLQKQLKQMSPSELQEIQELKQFRSGKPQDTIKIQKSGNRYCARFYVNGNPNYCESFIAEIKEGGEHSVVRYETVTVHNEERYSNVTKKTFHKQETAVNWALDTIKSNVETLMAFHGMPEHKNLNFVQVNN